MKRIIITTLFCASSLFSMQLILKDHVVMPNGAPIKLQFDNATQELCLTHFPEEKEEFRLLTSKYGFSNIKTVGVAPIPGNCFLAVAFAQHTLPQDTLILIRGNFDNHTASISSPTCSVPFSQLKLTLKDEKTINIQNSTFFTEKLARYFNLDFIVDSVSEEPQCIFHFED